MFATMARQGGRALLEQSNMCLALNMAKMAKEGFSRATIEEMQWLIWKPHAEVREEKKRGVVFFRHNKVKAAIDRHPAMIHQNQTDSCLPCQNGTAKNPQAPWRCKGTGTPPAEPAAPPPGTPPPPATPPAPPGDTDGNESYRIAGMPSSCVYKQCPHSNTEFFNHNPYAKDYKHDKDCIPGLLSILPAVWKYCWHSFRRRQQPFKPIWEWRRELIERNGSLEYYHYLQLADTLKYILKDIFICTIKEQCRDKWKRTWRG